MESAATTCIIDIPVPDPIQLFYTRLVSQSSWFSYIQFWCASFCRVSLPFNARFRLHNRHPTWLCIHFLRFIFTYSLICTVLWVLCLISVPLGFVPSSYNDRSDMLSAEEIGIIVIVLGVWMLAIVLFFNRCVSLSYLSGASPAQPWRV